MQIVTCQVGGSLRLGEKAGITIHARQGERIAFGAWAPSGTCLTLGGEAIHPVSGRAGVWSYLFSLYGCRRFEFGQYEFRIWLPGEVIELAADCLDSLHVGVDSQFPVPPPVYVPPAVARRGGDCAAASLPAWSPTTGRAAYQHARGA